MLGMLEDTEFCLADEFAAHRIQAWEPYRQGLTRALKVLSGLSILWTALCEMCPFAAVTARA